MIGVRRVLIKESEEGEQRIGNLEHSEQTGFRTQEQLRELRGEAVTWMSQSCFVYLALMA